MSTEMILMHLMGAKICHDLAAPMSAVAMGLEMLTETLAQRPQEPTLDLVTYSAQSTLSKLEVFRCLTGFSGAANKPTGKDLEKALAFYWPDGKIAVTWKVRDLENLQGPPARLVLAALLTAADGLPKGGTLTVHPNLSITAEGPTASLREDARQALMGKAALSHQTAHTIVAFFAHLLAKNLGGTLQMASQKADQFHLEIVKSSET